jgi:hypothetical protein
MISAGSLEPTEGFIRMHRRLCFGSEEDDLMPRYWIFGVNKRSTLCDTFKRRQNKQYRSFDGEIQDRETLP